MPSEMDVAPKAITGTGWDGIETLGGANKSTFGADKSFPGALISYNRDCNRVYLVLRWS